MNKMFWFCINVWILERWNRVIQLIHFLVNKVGFASCLVAFLETRITNSVEFTMWPLVRIPRSNEQSVMVTARRCGGDPASPIMCKACNVSGERSRQDHPQHQPAGRTHPSWSKEGNVRLWKLVLIMRPHGATSSWEAWWISPTILMKQLKSCLQEFVKWIIHCWLGI